MKSTGIVRRIDDLGRVVIPKEVRQSLNIREGDPLEIFIENDKVIFQRYHYDVVKDAIETLSDYMKDQEDSAANKTLISAAINVLKCIKPEE